MNRNLKFLPMYRCNKADLCENIIVPVSSFDFQCNYNALRNKHLLNDASRDFFNHFIWFHNNILPGYGKSPSEDGQVNGWSDGKSDRNELRSVVSALKRYNLIITAWRLLGRYAGKSDRIENCLKWACLCHEWELLLYPLTDYHV